MPLTEPLLYREAPDFYSSKERMAWLETKSATACPSAFPRTHELRK